MDKKEGDKNEEQIKKKAISSNKELISHRFRTQTHKKKMTQTPHTHTQHTHTDYQLLV